MQAPPHSTVQPHRWRSAGLRVLGWLAAAAAIVSVAPFSLGQSAPPAACPTRLPSNLRTTTQFGIFGDDAFDTAVCGYLVTRSMQVYDETVTIAYFRIVEFQADGFRRAIAAGVEQGNSINSVKENNYDFSLGCFTNQTIVTDRDDDAATFYLPEKVKTAILKSSAAQPIAVIFSFAKHRGAECLCCNLAHQIRLVNPAVRGQLPESKLPVRPPARALRSSHL